MEREGWRGAEGRAELERGRGREKVEVERVLRKQDMKTRGEREEWTA